MSGLINKVKDAIHSDKDKSHEQPTGTHGTHSSRAANAADPRIDSDRDHRANPGTTTGHHTTTGGLGSTGATGTHSSGLPEGSVGPHSSRAANAADPRVDSDLDSSRRTGATGSHGLSGTTGTTGGLTGGSTYSENMPGHTTGGLGHTGGMGRSENLPEGSVGPHSSRVANAADPRVDSDLDSSRRTGGLGGNTYDQTTTGTSGFSSHGAGAHGPTGTHTSGLGGTGSTGTYGSTGTGAGLGGTGSTGTYGSTGTGAGLGGAGSGYGTGPGPAPNTAGPHKSDALNKADPRVDSDLDGSKTVGKEKTFQQSNNNFAGRDPTDATQVPPSVLQKHVPTEIAHDDPHSDHSRRHSSTHQETHRGL
ncbi:period circadian [Fusarium napiforme]|uniref:Period circadian n=1 Tax=Fusarium napiforme TaxID=42672 RepID=A0A8H5NAU5_9HYPO|nr:period circadian [Fusarium napiforme]